MAAMPSADAGEEALERLRSADPPMYLSPSPELSSAARAAACHLFASLIPYSPKPPVSALLAEEGFDAEQIWSQIDLLFRPIVSLLRREVKRLELLPAPPVTGAEEGEEEAEKEEDGEKDEEEDEDDDEAEEDEEEEEEGEEEGKESGVGVEDQFLKINELEKYLEDDEAREFGIQRKGERVKGKAEEHDSDQSEDKDDEDEDEDDSEFAGLNSGDDEDAENARYEDFFVGKKERVRNRKVNIKDKDGLDGSKDQLSGEEEKDEMDIDTRNDGTLSKHEKELVMLRSKIQEMEEANLEPKTWTMQGEVTAAKRPKNSALEVDLDFEHNVRPPPVITEEVTASIEDLIKKRIIEINIQVLQFYDAAHKGAYILGHFDDVQRAPDLPSRAPKEFKELDETKSKKGLAEIYEEEYAQMAGLTSAPLSSSDEHKKEASLLFKRVCLKLDALAHFHFAPKPVIEEMSIQANVPALAMEEIAPIAVSDAAMLAPEEVFQGKGNIKEDAELTQADKKRRRAIKKRKFKAEKSKREAKKARRGASYAHLNEKDEGKEGS